MAGINRDLELYIQNQQREFYVLNEQIRKTSDRSEQDRLRKELNARIEEKLNEDRTTAIQQLQPYYEIARTIPYRSALRGVPSRNVTLQAIIKTYAIISRQEFGIQAGNRNLDIIFVDQMNLLKIFRTIIYAYPELQYLTLDPIIQGQQQHFQNIQELIRNYEPALGHYPIAEFFSVNNRGVFLQDEQRIDRAGDILLPVNGFYQVCPDRGRRIIENFPVVEGGPIPREKCCRGRDIYDRDGVVRCLPECPDGYQDSGVVELNANGIPQRKCCPPGTRYLQENYPIREGTPAPTAECCPEKNIYDRDGIRRCLPPCPTGFVPTGAIRTVDGIPERVCKPSFVTVVRNNKTRKNNIPKPQPPKPQPAKPQLPITQTPKLNLRCPSGEVKIEMEKYPSYFTKQNGKRTKTIKKDYTPRCCKQEDILEGSDLYACIQSCPQGTVDSGVLEYLDDSKPTRICCPDETYEVVADPSRGPGALKCVKKREVEEENEEQNEEEAEEEEEQEEEVPVQIESRGPEYDCEKILREIRNKTYLLEDLTTNTNVKNRKERIKKLIKKLNSQKNIIRESCSDCHKLRLEIFELHRQWVKLPEYIIPVIDDEDIKQKYERNKTSSFRGWTYDREPYYNKQKYQIAELIFEALEKFQRLNCSYFDIYYDLYHEDDKSFIVNVVRKFNERLEDPNIGFREKYKIEKLKKELLTDYNLYRKGIEDRDTILKRCSESKIKFERIRAKIEQLKKIFLQTEEGKKLQEKILNLELKLEYEAEEKDINKHINETQDEIDKFTNDFKQIKKEINKNMCPEDIASFNEVEAEYIRVINLLEQSKNEYINQLKQIKKEILSVTEKKPKEWKNYIISRETRNYLVTRDTEYFLDQAKEALDQAYDNNTTEIRVNNSNNTSNRTIHQLEEEASKLEDLIKLCDGWEMVVKKYGWQTEPIVGPVIRPHEINSRNSSIPFKQMTPLAHILTALTNPDVQKIGGILGKGIYTGVGSVLPNIAPSSTTIETVEFDHPFLGKIEVSKDFYEFYLKDIQNNPIPEPSLAMRNILCRTKGDSLYCKGVVPYIPPPQPTCRPWQQPPPTSRLSEQPRIAPPPPQMPSQRVSQVPREIMNAQGRVVVPRSRPQLRIAPPPARLMIAPPPLPMSRPWEQPRIGPPPPRPPIQQPTPTATATSTTRPTTSASATVTSSTRPTTSASTTVTSTTRPTTSASATVTSTTRPTTSASTTVTPTATPRVQSFFDNNKFKIQIDDRSDVFRQRDTNKNRIYSIEIEVTPKMTGAELRDKVKTELEGKFFNSWYFKSPEKGPAVSKFMKQTEKGIPSKLGIIPLNKPISELMPKKGGSQKTRKYKNINKRNTRKK